MAIIQSGAGASLLTIDPTSNAARATLYDANGNVIAVQGNKAAGTNQFYLPVAGLDGGQIIRAERVGEYGTLRSTSEVLLFHDPFEGTTINGNNTGTVGWVQSASTLTYAQANGVLTMNNGSGTGAGTYAILTSARQFPKYPRQPLYCRFRANLTANPAGNHTLAEMGIGAPSGVTAIINNGAFYRWRVDGTLAAVISFNGTEQVTQVLAQGAISTTSYYYYDVILDDDFVRFIVCDSAGTPIVDQQISLTLTSPYQWAVSHLPSFARVYVDGTGGGTAVQLKLSAHTVQMIDALNTKPWAEQQAGCGRSWAQSPLTQAQTPALASSAPGGGTPSNTATVYTTLGGEYIATITAASENMLSLFAYQIPSPYTLYIRGVYWSLPYVSTVFSISTTAPFILPFLIANASSTNISTATGKIGVAFGQMWTATITAAAGTQLTGNAISWTPSSAIACQPGTYLHFGWKVLSAGAVTTGAIRGSVLVDGYFE